MVWCSNCVKNVAGSRNEAGFLYCNACGKVLDFFNFSDEPTFTKDASGQSQFSGNFVKTIQSDFSASRERTLNRAMEEIRYMRNGLNMGDNEEVVRVACAFYRIAVERNFTRGRNSEHVQASCLYIACREKNKPYLLIDFSNYLRINVYVLGAVFLQLCKVLRLEEHPIIQKPVDPSLFIDKFTQGFLGGKEVENKKEISRTASKIISSMKRDWMQTGRKPSGLCGAALYISAVAHGVKCAKSDIVRIVHICDATLTKRLIEFENTESGSLTMEEFILMADKAKENGSSKLFSVGSNDVVNGSTKNEVLCIHKEECERPFALGLCRACYDDFMELSGGIDGGADPPAFQRAERERLAKSAAGEENIIDANAETSPSNHSKKSEKGLNKLYENSILQSADTDNGLVNEQTVIDEATNDGINRSAGMADSESNESDNFSDIDDVEVDGYIHNEEEKQYKKIIWEEMNREYLEEQAAKEAAAEAARCAQEAHFQNCSSDLLAAKELADATSAAVAKSRKEKQQKRAAEAKNVSPAQTAAEATRQMLTKKRLSSRINYDVLEKLFDESEVPEAKKKKQKEIYSENKGKHYEDKEKLDYSDAHLGDDEHDEGNIEGHYDTNLYGENIDDAHYYNDDDYANDDYANDDYE